MAGFKELDCGGEVKVGGSMGRFVLETSAVENTLTEGVEDWFDEEASVTGVSGIGVGVTVNEGKVDDTVGVGGETNGADFSVIFVIDIDGSFDSSSFFSASDTGVTVNDEWGLTRFTEVDDGNLTG